MHASNVTRASVGRAIGELSDAVAEQVADKIYAQLDSYATVPRASILGSVRRNMARGITVLIEGMVPTSIPEKEEAGDTTRERLEQGARWEDIVRAYRLSLTAVHEVFSHQAAEAGLNPQDILDGSFLLWELGDWFIEGSAQALTTWSAEVAGARAAAEAEFMRGLLTDDWQNLQYRTQLRRWQLDPDATYRVFIAPETSSTTNMGTTGRPGDNIGTKILVSAVFQHRLIGLISDDGPLQPTSQPVALGTAVGLGTLSESAHVAESIWPFASTQASGIYDLATLGWRVAVPQHPQLSNLLVERYITPLEPTSAAGQALIESLKVLLHYDGNIRLTAQTLQLHENSLRYRLERFSEKTGIQLNTIDHKTGLAWALQAYELQHTTVRFGEFYKNRDLSSETAP